MKRFLAVLTSVVMLLGIFTLCLSADETKTIEYGTDSLTLRVIDTFAGDDAVIDGYGSLGSCTIKDGKMFIESSHNMFDAYGIVTKANVTADWSGMKYVVFEVENTSDGDVYFGFQPAPENAGNSFMSSQLAKDLPVMLLNTKKGECKAAKWSGVQAINNRDCFIVPYKFTGYIFLPIGIMADLGSLGTPLMPDGGAFKDYGFHAYPDDATYIEITITSIYACAELPAYQAPEKPTEAPTEKPTEAPTAAPTEAPTAAPTEAPVVTAAPTEAPSEAVSDPATDIAGTETEKDGSGCGAVIGSSAAILLLACACAVVKRKNH
ncbi:MAG: hypothetical protein MJ192_09145 [Clostridia bacterium]|nr:hypothetical protein [Clostridia bacterium]